MNVMSQPLTIRKVTRQLIQTVIVLFLTSLLILNLNYKLIQSVPPTTASSRNNDINSFKLEHCNCFRTLEIRDSNEVIIDSSILYNETTCGWDAYHRGSHQKVAGFSFYGDVNTNTHKSKQYFEGIKENLELLTQLYDDSWTMRLYFDLDPADPQLTRLCDLACSNNHLDLCHVGSLPGTPVKDARKIFAMNWRFFPTLDPQVDIYMCRDLDSRFSQREVEAVKEWLEADKPLHSMRDHPAHNTPLLGASWGARLDQPHGNIRHKWTRQVFPIHLQMFHPFQTIHNLGAGRRYSETSWHMQVDKRRDQTKLFYKSTSGHGVNSWQCNMIATRQY